MTLLPFAAAQPESEPTATEPDKPALIDRLQKRVANTVDGSARWVDQFFGDNRYGPSETGAYGRLSVLPHWYEYRGVEWETRFRAYLPLENINHRLHAMIGRGDEDELINHDHGFEELVPSETGEDEWLVGLGYRPPWGESDRWSLGAGVQLEWPLDPYLRLSYRYLHHFNDNNLVRFRQTIFWRNSEKFGGNTSIDLERRISQDNLVRLSNWFKVSDDTERVRYNARLSLYRNLQDDRGAVLALGIRGDTGDVVQVRDYGVYAVYRQKMWREWFYGQVLTGVAMYREDSWPERELALIFGIGFEMFFSANDFQEGDWLDLRDVRSRW